ncbi:hypothetical protein ACQY1Q_05955 [Tenacibaculum sp. TC6]|uniref:hypothetical protein n=1 Tax=Tenacibaculum sp. TC6 TaxID=3423223 RepID=UPI003D35E4F4
MDNYRQYVVKYNSKVEKENEEIRKYNNVVVLKNFELSEAQKKRKANFQKANNYLFSREYNILVEKENENIPLYPKKTIQKIKFQTEIIFNVLVGFYVSQLKSRNAYLMNINRPTSVLKNSLPKLKIDHRKLANHKISEIPRLDICKKTAQNHVKRLREAGILVKYVQINQNKPIQVNFNSSILEVLDGNVPKSQTLENHNFFNGLEKVLHNNNDTTRTFLLKEKEIKDCANSTDLNKCCSIPEENASNTQSPAEGYKNTKGIAKKNKQAGGEIFKILPDFLKAEKHPETSNTQKIQAHNFLARLEDDQEMAEKLATGYYDDYKGLRKEYLLKIEANPLIDREEFRAVLIQDFIKSAAKIWKCSKVHTGNWKKAINQLNESSLFNQKSSNNTVVTFHKSTQIEYLKKYRWLLNFARKWFFKTKVTPLFPFAYFDTTRTKSNEIGFFGLSSVWKSHQKYQAKRIAEQKVQQAEASKRKNRLSNNEKLTKAIQRYELGRINHQQLYNYVQDNLPHEYLVQLSNLINKNNQNFA